MTMSDAPNVGKRAKNGHGSLAQIPGVTLAESLRQQLEGAIAAGHLEPGSRLDEQEIAHRFGVSRTPVREAFRLMAANNLVELRGRQGATVRAIKGEALIEMFQVMAELEGLCARLAARRVSQVGGNKISEIHQRLVAIGETGDIDLVPRDTRLLESGIRSKLGGGKHRQRRARVRIDVAVPLAVA